MAIIEVVKYNGGPDVFAWKYPSEELGTWTQLIVNETQEAILFKGGVALDVFGSGTHTLDTANIPILSNLINLPFGGRSPFTAEVWYVNKIFSLDIKWGTASPIQIQDPKYGVFVPIRSNGTFGIQIDDSMKFLLKLVGTIPYFDKASLVKYFRGLYITKVKDSISQYFVHKQISILEINAYIDELSEYLKERIAPTLEEYGIKLANFYVNEISVPEEDPAVIKLKSALAKRAEMNIIGYNYQQERSFNTLEGAARNPGSEASALMGAGIGLGMGAGMGRTVGSAFGDITGELNPGSSAGAEKDCPKCHSMNKATQRFCGNCGFDFDNVRENKEVIKCNNCGNELSKNVKFCPSCGNKYIPCIKCGADLAEDQTTCPECGYTKPIHCPQCDKEIAADSKFCPECGCSLNNKMNCKKCGVELTNDTKFCPECGEKQ